MSILLESLNQQEQPDPGSSSLPNLQSSHFDDDMLNDDDVYRQLKRWKTIAISSLALLAASWLGWFMFDNHQAVNLATFQELSQKQVQKQELSTSLNEKPSEKPSESSSESSSENSGESPGENQDINNSQSQSKNQNQVAQAKTGDELTTPESSSQHKSDTSSIDKTVYMPQKRSNESQQAYKAQNNQQPKRQSNTSNKSINTTNSKSHAQGAALLQSELSAELQNKFPTLAINSYVIADKAKDSFVIIDGGFYTVNQLISANLTLREINSDGIIVEFYQQRVKVPFE